MKAFALAAPDQSASLIDVPIPDVGESDVRVAVHAASVNGFDAYQANGYLFAMMEHTLPATIGRDFTGVVDAVGAGRDDVAVGDAVIGFIPSIPPLHSGAFAESLVGGPELVLVARPDGLDDETAASLPLAGCAAIDLLDAIAGAPGDTLLVVGATGGVGSLVVQLAVQRGRIVIATARPDEAAVVRSLGATEMVDYAAGSVAEAVRATHPDGIDALIDLVDQKDALTELASAVLRPGGRVASPLGAVDADALLAKGITGTNVSAAVNADKIRELAALAAAGKIRVPIQAAFPLDQAGDAIRAFTQGTRGKIVIRIA